MNTKTLIGGITLIAITIVIAFTIKYNGTKTPATQEIVTQKLTNTSFYVCANNTTILANYYADNTPSASSPSQSPIPAGSVKLTLSDNRTLELPQTGSDKGTRYTNKDETVVFLNKGKGVTLTENGKQTFLSCMEAAANTGDLDHVYGNAEKGMTIRYSADFMVDETYAYSGFGPAKIINGVKFTIPASIATGTNLGTDSYISVEKIPQSTTCTADLFLDMTNGGTVSTISEGTMQYSFASSTGAGAGNRYEETVYALPKTNPCVAVRYFVHYGAIENYPKTVKAFDKDKLLQTFDTIRKTLIVLE